MSKPLYYDERCAALRNRVLSVLPQISYIILGIVDCKLKPADTLYYELAVQYTSALEQYTNTDDYQTHKIAWEKIQDCYLKMLNLDNIPLNPIFSGDDLINNIDIILKSMGVVNGINDVLKNRIDPSVMEKIRCLKKQSHQKRSKESGEHQTSSVANNAPADINIFACAIGDLPEEKFSDELKTLLSRKYCFVYELFSTSFDELKSTLSTSKKAPIKSLVELELFFRQMNVDFFEHLSVSSNIENSLIKEIIEQTVTATLKQVKERINKKEY
ncbi:MAG: hypothetical protein HFG33_03705 [Bacilli bacterium]|nr:hypothetical protein [Bacilli bacterium]